MNPDGYRSCSAENGVLKKTSQNAQPVIENGKQNGYDDNITSGSKQNGHSQPFQSENSRKNGHIKDIMQISQGD